MRAALSARRLSASSSRDTQRHLWNRLPKIISRGFYETDVADTAEGRRLRRMIRGRAQTSPAL